MDDGPGDTFAPESVLAVFHDRADPARPLTANDIMDALGCCRRTAHNKLETLVERNELATRKVGARGRVWWIPLRQPTASASATADGNRPIETSIATAELPGPEETLTERREALRAAYDYPGENPDATESEFLTEVFPEYPAGFQTADKWWATIRPALEDLPGVDIAETRERIWRFTGG